MNKITRRLFLRTAPAVAAVSTVVATPAVMEAKEEFAVTRVNRIAKELSKAMDEWMADLAVPGGPPTVMKAHVYPASYHQYPVMFEDVDHAVTTRRERALWHMRELERLISEDGAKSSAIILVGANYPATTAKRNRTFMIGHTGDLYDEDDMFRGLGNAS